MLVGTKKKKFSFDREFRKPDIISVKHDANFSELPIIKEFPLNIEIRLRSLLDALLFVFAHCLHEREYGDDTTYQGCYVRYICK